MDVAWWNVLVSAIGAFFAALATGGIFIAARQLRLDAWVKAQEIFTNPDFIKARAGVFQSQSRGTRPLEKDASEVCRRMDELARIVPFLSYRRGRAEKKALRAWDDPIGKAWHALEAFVSEERGKTGWTTKWEAFERLGKKSWASL
jgi:hypothetical protein